MPVFQGIKKTWLNLISQQLIKRYFNTNVWGKLYYDSFDNFCIKKWGSS